MERPVVFKRGLAPFKGHFKTAGFLAAFTAAGLTSSVFAASGTWQNGSTNPNEWGTNGQRPQNWVSSSVPQNAGDIATFNTTGAGTITIATGAGFSPTVGGITFNSTAGYVLQGNTITFNNSGTAQLNVLSGNTASHTISSLISLANPVEISNQSSGTLALSGVVSGTGGILKSGNGTVVVSGSNTYTGGTTISAGTFFIDGNQTGATGAVAVNGGVLGGNGGIIGGDTTIANNATLSPGKGSGISTLTFQKNLTLAGVDSKVNLTISGTSRGVTYDSIAVSGSSAVVLNGDLTLDITTALSNGTNYDLLFGTPASLTGSFQSITLTGLYSASFINNGSGIWTATSGSQLFTYTQSTGDLSVIPEPMTQLYLGLGVAMMFWLNRSRRKETLET